MADGKMPQIRSRKQNFGRELVIPESKAMLIWMFAATYRKLFGRTFSMRSIRKLISTWYFM